jgi:protein-S-isoprenylcysteine O-methyltransferase Ste14
MNLYGLLTLALAAQTRDPPIKLTQDPTFDLLVVALALALLLIIVGYTQFSVDRSPVARPSSTLPTWIQVIGLIVVLLILIVIKNN